MIELLFWLFLGTGFYAYAGYPILLWLMTRLFKKRVRKGRYEPRISVIISAFNEERFIEKKLLNLLTLDYPEKKIEVLVGSDGAHDATDAIVSKFPTGRIRFFKFVQNQGKPQVLNSLVREAHGTILVFTDARQEFARKAIRELVENFHDQEVGCVSGELLFCDGTHRGVSQGMGAYWNYEKYLRRCESELGSMLGATGAIYAIRRQLFTPIPSDILVDDMYVPLSIVKRGHRAIFDSAPKAYDQVSTSGKQEMTRKIRTLAGNWQIFSYFPELLSPAGSPIWWQLLSHKLLRLIVPYLMLGLMATNLALIEKPFYFATFAAQVIFYGLAAIGGKGIGSMPYTLCLLNYSAFLSLFQFLNKKKSGAWQKAYV